MLLGVSLIALELRKEKKFLQAFSCNENLIVTDTRDYMDVRTGKSPGHGLVEGERIVEEYRTRQQKKFRRR